MAHLYPVERNAGLARVRAHTDGQVPWAIYWNRGTASGVMTFERHLSALKMAASFHPSVLWAVAPHYAG